MSRRRRRRRSNKNPVWLLLTVYGLAALMTVLLGAFVWTDVRRQARAAARASEDPPAAVRLVAGPGDAPQRPLEAPPANPPVMAPVDADTIMDDFHRQAAVALRYHLGRRVRVAVTVDEIRVLFDYTWIIRHGREPLQMCHFDVAADPNAVRVSKGERVIVWATFRRAVGDMLYFDDCRVEVE